MKRKLRRPPGRHLEYKDFQLEIFKLEFPSWQVHCSGSEQWEERQSREEEGDSMVSSRLCTSSPVNDGQRQQLRRVMNDAEISVARGDIVPRWWAGGSRGQTGPLWASHQLQH